MQMANLRNVGISAAPHRTAPRRYNNDRTISREAIEARVLAGLKSALFTPDLVRTFVAEFQSEWNRLQAEADADWTASRRTLEQTKAKIEAVMNAIENGIQTPTTQERLLALEAEQKRLKALTPPEPLPRLHPALAELYRAKVARLHEALDREELRTEAAEALRGLIEAVRLTPEADGDGLEIELYGELGALLRFAQERDGSRGEVLHGAPNDERPASFPAGRSLSMVAGARNHLNLLFDAPLLGR